MCGLMREWCDWLFLQKWTSVRRDMRWPTSSLQKISPAPNVAVRWSRGCVCAAAASATSTSATAASKARSLPARRARVPRRSGLPRRRSSLARSLTLSLTKRTRCMRLTGSLLCGGHLQAGGRAGQAFPQSVCKEPASAWQLHRSRFRSWATAAAALRSFPQPADGPKADGPAPACRPSGGLRHGSASPRCEVAVRRAAGSLVGRGPRPRLACPHQDLAWAGWPIGTPPSKDPPRTMTLGGNGKTGRLPSCTGAARQSREQPAGLPGSSACAPSRPEPGSACVTGIHSLSSSLRQGGNRKHAQATMRGKKWI